MAHYFVLLISLSFLNICQANDLEITKRLDILETRNVDLRDELDQVKAHEVELIQEVHQIKALNAELKQNDVDQQIEQLQEKVDQMETVISNMSGSVAFRVGRSTNLGPVTEDTPIVYDIVEMNVGAGFDIITGEFTAPIAGIYHFSQTHRHDNFVLHTAVNGVNVMWSVAAESAGSNPTGSVSFTIQLAAGDIVKNMLDYNPGSAELYCPGINDCSFTGFLVYTIL